jgi:hypothetical protein
VALLESVIVDLAAETGGNRELTEPGESVIRHDVKILRPRNVPSTMAEHASCLKIERADQQRATLIRTAGSGCRGAPWPRAGVRTAADPAQRLRADAVVSRQWRGISRATTAASRAGTLDERVPGPMTVTSLARRGRTRASEKAWSYTQKLWMRVKRKAAYLPG